ncbi:MAG: DUF1572 domain-containing protein, partial [Pedobacter sp.]
MHFLPSAIRQFTDYKTLADKTFEQLSDAEMLFEPVEGVNSVAIIIQHMHGNMLSRWSNFLTEDGEKEWRKRDEEFDPSNKSKNEIIRLWEEGWKCLFDTLTSLTEDDLYNLQFALEWDVDWIGLSFVRTGQDIIDLKRIIRESGKSARVIAKVEKPEAIDNIDEIIAATDGVMIARGDLGV